MMAFGYTLDLYCDADNDDHEWKEFPHIYFKELGSACRRLAKKDGWHLDFDNNKALCPKCNNRKNRKMQRDQIAEDAE